MAMVLPALRLCLLFLNLYGTFKAIKSPPMSQRNTRNGQGPSGRAMQLRKREMKSRLAVWVVWAIFAVLEHPLDCTIGFVTPFYNEFKCTTLLFLIVSRSHGAEAIFLHFIHPLVRPYVPAVDNTLATLHSVFELVSLILFLPLEYFMYWWHQWSWRRFWSSDKDHSNNGECSPDVSDLDGKEEDQRQLRPRSKLRQGRMREADRQAQVILQDIEDAQDRVRTRTRNQLTARHNVRTQPVLEQRNTDSNAVGLRNRRRVLDHSNGLPGGVKQIPGSRSTGIHHLDPTTIAQLARGPAPPQVPFPTTLTVKPIIRQSSPIRMPTPSSSSQSSHEIWYPPHSAFEARKRKSPSQDVARTPSPVYPPLPSAYRFTPRCSDPQPPPRIITSPNLVTPTPRRVSTGGMSRGAVDAYDGIDQFPGRTSQAGPSASARLADPSLHVHGPHTHHRARPEDFFRQALEPSIQTMDVDMETLSTRDGTSANEESMEGHGEIRPGLLADASARSTEGTYRSSHETVTGIIRRSHKPIEPAGSVRRSARTRRDRSSSVETDEFGFTIRQDSIALKILATEESSSVSSFGSGSLAPGQTRKKPLARTKPVLKSTQEEAYQSDISDEESAKKRRKLRPGTEGQPRASATNKHQLEVSRLGGDTKPKAGDARKKVTTQRTMQKSDSPESVLKDRQMGTRVTRASTRQPQSRPTVTKRDRRK